MTTETSQATAAGAGQPGTQTGVSLGTQTAGAQTQQATATQTGSDAGAAAGAKPWFDGLVKDADNLKTIDTKKWDSAEAVIKSYRELEAAYSSKGAAPTAPSDPKEYTFTVPADLKDGYNQQFADAFRGWAHKAGLSKEAAASVHDAFVAFARENLTGQSQAAAQALEKSVATTKADLEKAWGQMGTPGFTRSLEMAKRAIGNLDPNLAQELRDIGVITKVGDQEMITKPALFKALAKAGTQMFAEDTLYGEAAKIANPFDPKTENRQAQAALVRADPEKAKLLIRAAKVDKDWGHFLNP